MSCAPDPRRQNHPQRSPYDGLPVLLLAACPLVFWLFLGSIGVAVAALAYFALLASGLALIAAGREVEARYNAARAAPRPKLPRKLLGSLVIGLTACLLAANHYPTWKMPLVLGAAAYLLSAAAFGLDPQRDKGLDDPRLKAERAAQKTLADADEAMAALVDRVALLGETDLTLRTEAVRSAMLRLIRALAVEPEEFEPFRRPLTRFVELAESEVDALEAGWAENSDRAARRYAARIAALSDGFETRARQRRAVRQADAFALDADLLLDRMRENTAA